MRRHSPRRPKRSECLLPPVARRRRETAPNGHAWPRTRFERVPTIAAGGGPARPSQPGRREPVVYCSPWPSLPAASIRLVLKTITADRLRPSLECRAFDRSVGAANHVFMGSGGAGQRQPMCGSAANSTRVTHLFPSKIARVSLEGTTGTNSKSISRGSGSPIAGGRVGHLFP
jgi:hypothetical protein